MTRDQIDRLLDIAGVDRSNEDARTRLQMALDFLPHPDAKARPTGRDWNDPLKEISEQAEELSDSLRKLRLQRHQHVDFWSFEQFGDVDFADPAPDYHAAGETGLERGGVLSMLERIAAAAKAAQRQDKGRPADKRKRRTVEAAANFLQRFCPEAPLSGTPTGLFREFATAFYEAVYGGRAELDRMVREVAAERASTKLT